MFKNSVASSLNLPVLVAHFVILSVLGTQGGRIRYIGVWKAGGHSPTPLLNMQARPPRDHGVKENVYGHSVSEVSKNVEHMGINPENYYCSYFMRPQILQSGGTLPLPPLSDSACIATRSKKSRNGSVSTHSFAHLGNIGVHHLVPLLCLI